MIYNNSSTERSTIRSFGFWFALWVVLVAIDQISKVLIVDYMNRYFANYNFAFSLPVPFWLMYFLYFIILTAMAFYVIRNVKTFSNLNALAWTLIFAGSLSNISERLVLGYVRDFIYIFNGIFNIADFFILIGLGLLLYWEYRHR